MTRFESENERRVRQLVEKGILNKVDLRALGIATEKEEPFVAYFVVDDRPQHVCDWRFYGRRPDGLADVVCVALGHDVNTRMRVAPKIVDNDHLPKYEGQYDV